MTEHISNRKDGLVADQNQPEASQSWHWNSKQLLGLSPDVMTVKATARLIDPARWELLGQNDTFIWGLLSRPNLSPHKIFVRLADLTGECSCISTKHPCKFLIALLVLFADNKSLFAVQQTPEWVKDQLLPQTSSRHQSSITELNEIQAGMAEFGRWLRDQARQGIANFAERQAADLESMANRLIDAHMPRIANDLRELGKTACPPKGHPPDNWPEILIKGFGKFYLLTQAWKRYDRLSLAEQNDLIRACVFSTAKSNLQLAVSSILSVDTHLNSDIVTDRWMVLGRRFETFGKNWVRRTWLYGLDSQRFAVLEDGVSGRRRLLSNLVTGSIYSVSVRFEAGTTAFIGRPVEIPIPIHIPAAASLLTSPKLDFIKIETDFIKALTANPWLRVWPMILNSVRLQIDKHHEQWLVVDEQGQSIPVQNGAGIGWYLLAASSGRPIRLFGEWSADGLHLVSVFYEENWLDLTVWGSRP
ncbi:MAG: hypothetical protein ACI9EW_002636 [Cellvibrionaceae bacterium]|jgi:hypothetical protein